MSGMDLDALRGSWNNSQRQLDNHLDLDLQTLRAALRKRTSTAFRRHQGWLLSSLIGATIMSAALTVFIISHLNDAIYLLLAAPLLMLALAEWIIDYRQWRALDELDLSAPVLQVQGVLDTLRGRVLRLAKWGFLLAVLLWLPMVLVFFKGLFDVDLLDYLHPSVIYVNLLVGVIYIPIAWLVMKGIARIYRDRPGFARFLDEVAGRSWQKARLQFDAQQRFEFAVQSGAALAKRADPVVLAAIASPLRALSSRLLLTIVVYAALMLLTGVFNVSHGAQVRFLLPALLLHFFWLAHMVLGIVQRGQLVASQADFAAIDQLDTIVQTIRRVRLHFARWALIASPLLALAMAQVIAKAVLGIDLLLTLGAAEIWLAATAMATSLGLAWKVRTLRSAWVAAIANLLSLGGQRAASEVLSALESKAD